jgi:HEAT repeat protein
MEFSLPDKYLHLPEVQARLAEVAKSGIDIYDRALAIKKLNDQNTLEMLAQTDKSFLIRKEAVKKIKNQEVLSDIAYNDLDCIVRIEAVQHLTDQEFVKNICTRDLSPEVRVIALNRLKRSNQDIFKSLALNDYDWKVRYSAIWRLNPIFERESQLNCLLEDPVEYVRQAYVEKIQHQHLLTHVVLTDSSDNVRYTAVHRVSDPNCLAEIALKSTFPQIREIVAEKISDQHILRELSLKDVNRWVRDTAVNNLIPDLNTEVLFLIATSDTDENVRYSAICNLSDEEFLKKIVLESPYVDSTQAAIQRISNLEVLAFLRLIAKKPFQKLIQNRIRDLTVEQK